MLIMAAKSSTKKPGRPIWVWPVLILGALALAGLLYSPYFKDLVENATHWAEGIMDANPVMGAVIFFLFSALSALLAFASSAVLVPAANLAWGAPVTFLLLWGGWLVGAIAAYGIGRVAHPLLVRLGYGETLAKYEKFVSSRMRFWTVLVLCIAIPSEIPGYLLGGAHYPFLRFLAAMGIAEGLYALGVVIMGDSLMEAEPGVLLAAAGALIAAAAVATLVLRKTKKRAA